MFLRKALPPSSGKTEFCNLTEYCYDRIKQDEIGGKRKTQSQLENMKREDCLGDRSIDERILLK
jgi:hypothetical protein